MRGIGKGIVCLVTGGPYQMFCTHFECCFYTKKKKANGFCHTVGIGLIYIAITIKKQVQLSQRENDSAMTHALEVSHVLRKQ